MYTIKDIDIFVITHNRANYLDKLLYSYANQSVDILTTQVSVLCNDCYDNTKSIVEKYPFARYIPTFGTHGNYYKAMELVNKEYFIMLHDDDIIHPQYFERMLNILNFLSEKPVLLGAGYTNFFNENTITKKYNESLLNKYYIAKSNKNFSKLVLSNFCRFSYAAAIFKTEFYKKFDNIQLMDKYGRLADFFVMTEILKYGTGAILQDNNAYFHRLHKNSDTNCKETLLTDIQFDSVVNDFANLTNKFKGFSISRFYQMFEKYFSNKRNPISIKNYFYKNENISLEDFKLLNLYIDLYQKRYDNFTKFIQYLIYIKLNKKIKSKIKYNDIDEITENSILIELN